MKKHQLLITVAVCLVSLSSHASLVNLDFSSGMYYGNSNYYSEDGFLVTASDQFEFSDRGVLAWYDTSDYFEVKSDAGSLFNLEQLQIVVPAYAGLTFESSKGGSASFGSISGPISFSGDEWRDIESFNIRTIVSSFDIYNAVDNIQLSYKVPEPSTLVLFGLGLAGLGVRRLRLS